MYAARWDDIIDPIGDDPHDCEEFFAYLHLVLTHKPATDKLIEDFLADVCNRTSTKARCHVHQPGAGTLRDGVADHRTPQRYRTAAEVRSGLRD